MFVYLGVLGGVEVLFALFILFIFVVGVKVLFVLFILFIFVVVFKDFNFVCRLMVFESVFVCVFFVIVIFFRVSAIFVNNRFRFFVVSVFGLLVWRLVWRLVIFVVWCFFMLYIFFFKCLFLSCSVEVVVTEDDGVGVSYVFFNSFFDMNVDIKLFNFFDNVFVWVVIFFSLFFVLFVCFCFIFNSFFCCVIVLRSKCFSRCWFLSVVDVVFVWCVICLVWDDV